MYVDKYINADLQNSKKLSESMIFTSENFELKMVNVQKLQTRNMVT